MADYLKWYGDTVLSEVERAVEEGLGRLGAAMVSSIQDEMARTPRKGPDTRGKWARRKGLIKGAGGPSQPYHAPAVQKGTLKNSIHHEPIGKLRRRVGSRITDPPYGLYLELGTCKMAPRPWLRPALYRFTGRTGEELFERLIK